MIYKSGTTFSTSMEEWKYEGMEVQCTSFKVHFHTSILPYFHT